MMPGSMECTEFSGRRSAARLPEKPTFSRTCSLLSRYLKEKGSFGDLSLGITCNADANGAFAASRQPTTMNLFPCEVSNKDLQPKEEALKMTDSVSEVNRSANPETQAAQMTIFYAGKVLVFDDFPAEKAKELMNLACKSGDKSCNGFTSNFVKTQSSCSPNLAIKQAESRSSGLIPVPDFEKALTQEQIQPSHEPMASELPIARRVSLHRFLEKRKNRITSRAPYQTNGQDAARPEAAGNKPWIGIYSQSPQ